MKKSDAIFKSMGKLMMLLMLFCFTMNANAQTADKKWNIGFHGGAEQYKGDLGNDFYKTNKAFYGFAGISFTRFLGNRLDVSLLVTKGEIGFQGDTINSGFKLNMTTGTVNFRFNILNADALIRPYIFVGGGALL